MDYAELVGAPGINTRIAYIATRSPISEPFARFKQAEKMKRDFRAGTIFHPHLFAGLASAAADVAADYGLLLP